MDDVLGVLSRLQPSGYANDADDLIADGWSRERLLAALQQCDDRGLAHIAKPLRGDNRLLAARQINLTATGRVALEAEVASGGLENVPEDAAPTLTVKEKRERRAAFMRRLYEMTDGNRSRRVDYRQFGEAFGWPEIEAFAVAQYLVDEGLADWKALGGLLGITHAGVVEVEQLLQAPDKPTQHFEPVTNIHVVVQGDNLGQIQAGTNSSSQVANAASPQVIELFLAELRAALAASPDEPARGLAEGTITVVEGELAAGRAESSTVKGLLPGLRDLALGIASSGAFEGLKAAAMALPI